MIFSGKMAKGVELQRTLNEVENYLDTLSNDERELLENYFYRCAMAGMTNSEFYEVSKAIFCDENFIKYFSMVCHHYRIESGSSFSEI